MQNLREAIAGYRARLAAEPDDDKRSDLLRVALEYLERYCVLIVFATYLAGPGADPDGGVVVVVEESAAAGSGGEANASASSASVVGASLAPFRRPSPPLPSLSTATAATKTRRVPHEPFAEWMRSRPELRSVLARMLRRNPLAALELHHHLEESGGEEGTRRGGGPASAAAAASTRRARSARSAVSSPQQQHTQTEDEDSFYLDDDDDASSSAALDAAAALVAGRRGAVLGPSTILKEDHYPGCQAPRLRAAAAVGGGGGGNAAASAAEAAAAAAATAAAGGVAPVRGAPNFRRVPGGAHVYGGGTPTTEGVRGVLSAVLEAEEAERKAKKKNSSGGGGGGEDEDEDEDESSLPPLPVLWVNLREEVCLYVNGRPYVLREAERPFKNMREYVGISPRRLEAMEARLRADVLREASESLASSSDPLAASLASSSDPESSGGGSGSRRTAAVLVAREEEPAGRGLPLLLLLPRRRSPRREASAAAASAPSSTPGSPSPAPALSQRRARSTRPLRRSSGVNEAAATGTAATIAAGNGRSRSATSASRSPTAPPLAPSPSTRSSRRSPMSHRTAPSSSRARWAEGGRRRGWQLLASRGRCCLGKSRRLRLLSPSPASPRCSLSPTLLPLLP